MRTTTVQIVMVSHVNGSNRLFGGQLMQWIDVTAAVEARRHAFSDVTTAAVDALEFLAPVFLNDLLVLQAEVTWTGKTSIEVRVETFREHLNGERVLVNRAYFLFVAVDNHGKPREVEPFVPRGPVQLREWDNAITRREHRLKMREEMNALAQLKNEQAFAKLKQNHDADEY
ncbi:MAG: acyl-CoA thioesterase [Eubacteriales bacterium]|nr:acyl-CoA thioesterase [Eubacteriales bacterium]